MLAMMDPVRRKGSKVHAAVDTLGNLLVTPTNEQDRAQVGELAQAVQDVTAQSVESALDLHVQLPCILRSLSATLAVDGKE